MKHIPLLTLSILFIFLCPACQEKLEQPIEAPQYFRATLSGTEWIATPEINMDSYCDTVTILGVGTEEVLYFKIKLESERVYELTGSQAVYYTTVGQDAVTSEYHLDSSQVSSVTVASFDKGLQQVEGRFNIYLQKRSASQESEIQTLHFTNGAFKGEITSYH
jgi:hypothetical protein